MSGSCPVCGREHPLGNLPRKQLAVGRLYRVVYDSGGGNHRGFTGAFTGIREDPYVPAQRGYGFTVTSEAVVDLATGRPVPLVNDAGEPIERPARGLKHLIWQLDLVGLAPA